MFYLIKGAISLQNVGAHLNIILRTVVQQSAKFVTTRAEVFSTSGTTKNPDFTLSRVSTNLSHLFSESM